tara:strand:- start:640 stop:1584 length:945 start_codon:yes stop_codon:yes gene_type:complete
MPKKYLVTGGLGFIGKAIVRSLLSKNKLVTVVDNGFKENNLKDFKHDNLSIYKVDVRNKRELQKTFRNINTVIHLAFINGTNLFYKQPELVLDVALKGMLNILEISKEKSVKDFFLASSSEVYQNPPYFPTDEKVPLSIPNPLNPRYSYAAGKILSEVMLLNSNIFKRAVIFRPHNIYGPNMGYNHVIPELVLKALKSKKYILVEGSGLQTRTFCHINDFVNGFNILLSKAKNKNIYNIGTESEITIKNLSKNIIKISKKKLQIKNMKEKFGDPQRRIPNISKLKKLGYKPKINLIKGLEETYKWYSKDFIDEI